MSFEINAADRRDSRPTDAAQRPGSGDPSPAEPSAPETIAGGMPENVAQAWAMLRQAADLGERAIAELSQSPGRVNAVSQQRALLAALRADVAEVQEQVDRLARRVADVITAFESAEPGAGGTPPASTPPATRRTAPGGNHAEASASGGTGEQADSFPELASPFRARATTPVADRGRPRPVPVTVVVQGMPHAAMALSLQRYLISLNQVTAVEPERFAEGELRLRVTTAGPLGFEELRKWPDGERLASVSTRPDHIEVRLSASRDE